MNVAATSSPQQPGPIHLPIGSARTKKWKTGVREYRRPLGTNTAMYLRFVPGSIGPFSPKNPREISFPHVFPGSIAEMQTSHSRNQEVLRITPLCVEAKESESGENVLLRKTSKPEVIVFRKTI